MRDPDEIVTRDLGDYTGRVYDDDAVRLPIGRRLTLGIHLLEQLAGVPADELDERRDPQRLPDVVHVEDEHHDADDDENERHDHRHAGHGGVIAKAHFTQRQDGVCECGDEDADGELARLVL